MLTKITDTFSIDVKSIESHKVRVHRGASHSQVGSIDVTEEDQEWVIINTYSGADHHVRMSYDEFLEIYNKATKPYVLKPGGMCPG